MSVPQHHVATSLWDLPSVPAVYVFLGGPTRITAFVGGAVRLRERVIEQLGLRASGLPRSGAPLPLEPSYVSQLRWWQHDVFVDSHSLRAAELVATDVLRPLLYGRGPISQLAQEHRGNKVFRNRMERLFRGAPSGELTLPTIETLLERLARLEEQINETPTSERSQQALSVD